MTSSHNCSTDDYQFENTHDSKINLEVHKKKEETLLDDFSIDEIKTEKKEKIKPQVKKQVRYEKLTLEDIFNDDEF